MSELPGSESNALLSHTFFSYLLLILLLPEETPTIFNALPFPLFVSPA
jgi:hypothetical protein